MSNDTSGPAFPTENAYTVTTQQGMTLRDYFAAKAMQGLMSTDLAYEYVDEETGIPNDGEDGTLFVHTKHLALESYMIADMMLEARK